jgi:drug/metabolite transporter (DMT)-like permease
MPLYELAALGAAPSGAATGLGSAGAAQHLGAIPFTRLRMSMVFVMLAIYVAASGRWRGIGEAQAAWLALSGFIGIFVGDTALFLTLNRLGPRRTGILFSMNAPLAVLLGWIFLDEQLSAQDLLGIVTTFAGVVLAIVFGKRRAQLHHWEHIRGPLWIGLTLGFLAALAQAVGTLIARPAMESGVDPIVASTIRSGIAAAALILFTRLPVPGFRSLNPLNLRILAVIALSGFLAMALGMTLLLFALSGGKVGIVSTLSATTPALLLPLLWLRTREAPAPAAWAGAALVVAGTGLIFSG